MMPARYDVYGFASLNIEEARSLVESTLALQLERRDSSYWGIYYRYRTGSNATRNLMLYKNEQGEWHTPEYQAFSVILLVNELDNMDEIKCKLTSGRTKPVLLRSRILPDEGLDNHDK
jgi:hypothetical protein